MVHISFSWDDGPIEDLRLMDLSLKYNIPGIFFIPAINSERGVMSKENIKTLAKNNFEVGAHTYSHSYLTNLSLKQADEELFKGKNFLEQLLGKEIPHFCFPGGKYNSELVEMSKKYFWSGRSADTCAFVQNNSFLIKPTFQFFDRGKKSLLYNGLKNNSIILKMTFKNILISNYFELIKKIITELYNEPDLKKIIIWGHSWELEEFKLWDILEDFFRYINDLLPGSILGYSDFLNYKHE